MQTILISDSQKWVLAKALWMFTSDQGEAALKEEFPDLNFEELEKDLEGIFQQLETVEAREPSEGVK